MAVISETVKQVLMIGANVSILEGRYTPDELKHFAMLAKSHEAHLKINATHLTSDTMKGIAMVGKGNVTFIV